jgi:hypothetical protein
VNEDAEPNEGAKQEQSVEVTSVPARRGKRGEVVEAARRLATTATLAGPTAFEVGRFTGWLGWADMPATLHPEITGLYLQAMGALRDARSRGEISDDVFHQRRERIEAWLADRQIMVPGGLGIEWKLPGKPIRLQVQTLTFS